MFLVDVLVSVVCFFFFQAEDGIRDVAVTGVQTCALPIFGEPIESELAVTLEAFGRKPAVDFFEGFVAWMRPHGIAQAAAAGDLLKRGVKKPANRSEEHTSELQSRLHLVCRLLLEKKKTST